MHNDVIKSDIHSTDTHGYSEVIFAATFFLNFTFAPRIKGLGRQKLCMRSGTEKQKQRGKIPRAFNLNGISMRKLLALSGMKYCGL